MARVRKRRVAGGGRGGCGLRLRRFFCVGAPAACFANGVVGLFPRTDLLVSKGLVVRESRSIRKRGCWRCCGRRVGGCRWHLCRNCQRGECRERGQPSGRQGFGHEVLAWFVEEKPWRSPQVRWQRNDARSGPASQPRCGLDARGFVRDRRRPGLDQHERLREGNPRQCRERRPLRQPGDGDDVAAGSADTALVGSIGQGLGWFCHAHVVRGVRGIRSRRGMGRVVVMADGLGCSGMCTRMLRIGTTVQHRRRSHSLQGNGNQQKPDEEQAQHGQEILLILRARRRRGGRQRSSRAAWQELSYSHSPALADSRPLPLFPKCGSRQHRLRFLFRTAPEEPP